ncbi:uncharacterized protein LOC128981962 isoform X2 [Macrosteles quadrilineatus]|uniref:uncharacterized protein LOC128981962 isoform X2 n=1 Tax=Macrosteles quadrilineatus TaxID=74068 RepID=UPI0023E1F031|nr:uncharacterized protein LOC128981962 isoform X2 [Macrosteles quadrilineatus]
MTEVASGGLQVLSVQRYEAPAPANLPPQQLVDPESAFATTKEEEWVTKKKVELTTKRQIETRVKRQVVLEDGKVVEDTGPIVTTNTTEDTEKQESCQTEHRQLGDDDVDGDGGDRTGKEGWVAVPGQGGVVKEVKERTVKSREEKEERLETEDVQHLGDISDEQYLSAIQRQSQEGVDLRVALVGQEVARPHEGRIVHQSCKTKKVVDTDDRRHLSELQADGRVVTETKRTTEHEEINNTEEPDDGRGSGGEEEEEVHKSSSQHYTKTKDQEFVDYLADGKRIGREMRYEAENMEGDRQGDTGLLEDPQEWDSLSTRIRKMRRNKLHQLQREGIAGASPIDRKDALTKKPLDFDQEEETRKVETSKWLEHHFGSESRSSKDSLGDDDDLPATGTSTSFINVTMKSTKNGSKVNGVDAARNLSSSSRVFVSSPEAETPPPPPTTYFQGISEWRNSKETSREPERPARTSVTSPGLYKDRVQVLPTGPNHTFTPSKSSPSPPYPSSSLGSKNFRGSQGSNLNLNGRNSSGPESSSPFQSITEKHVYNRYYRQENGSSPSQDRGSPYERSASPHNHNSHPRAVNGKTSSTEEEPHRPASPRHHRRYNGHSSHNGHNGHVEREDSDDQRVASSHLIHRERESYHQRLEEPAPDYSPPSPRGPTPDNKKKIYQRTRFAADIPPVRTKTAQSTQTPHKTSLGESFRKFVGKFRSSSKDKRRKKGSRSPSPSYHSYNVGGGTDDEAPIAPPRSHRHRDSGSQTIDRAMRRGGDPVQKYYLGEDPFGGSIYGREKEYDGVTPFRRKHRRGSENLEDERNARNQQLNSSSTLGRFSKSTSRLISNNHVTNNHVIDYSDRGGVQTLPRKLHEEKTKKQVYVTKSNAERISSSPHSWESQRYKVNGNPNSNSMINVSIVNKTSPTGMGPAKPARTYRSSLLRSKSFNVHGADMSPDFNSIHKSNPQLHRLDESPPPLKSPGIVTSISRSTKDITQAINEEDYRRPFGYSDHINKSTGHLNGYTNSRTVHDTKKKIFMKNLQDRAPELYRTLHGNEANDSRKLSPDIDDRSGRLFTSTPLKNGSRVLEYSNSFRSSNTSSPLVNGSDRVNSPISPTYTTSITHTPSFRTNGGEMVNRSIVRRGSNDDYSETVRITSKSDDPLRPSVTNTVQSFSKKTVPVKGGRGKETIESSETKTITKSHYRGRDDNNKYAPRNGGGGVVIEVRNNPK